MGTGPMKFISYPLLGKNDLYQQYKFGYKKDLKRCSKEETSIAWAFFYGDVREEIQSRLPAGVAEIISLHVVFRGFTRPSFKWRRFLHHAGRNLRVESQDAVN